MRAAEPVGRDIGLPHELHATSVVACEYTTCSSPHSAQFTLLNLLLGSGTGILDLLMLPPTRTF